MIKQFVHDMIRMTEGEKLINYWWLWLMALISSSLIMYIYYKMTE